MSEHLLGEEKNFTVEVRIHCTREEANKLADLVSDFADNAIQGVDADIVLVDADTRDEL